MKKILLSITLLALVAFASGVMAIQKPAPEPASEAAASTTPGKPTLEKTKRFSGVIEKVDERGKSIVVKGKMMKEEKAFTFAIDDKTRIIKDKASITVRDLKKDMEVSIEYREETGKIIAVAIRASTPKVTP
jgi:uncharacterized protein YpmB